MIYLFQVVEKIKGEVVDDTVYVEGAKPTRKTAATFEAAADKDADAILYLRKAPPLGNRTFPAPEPTPANSPMMNFTTPQGFLVWLDGTLVTPLALNSRPLFPDGDPDRSALRNWLPPR